jgi:TRIAD3 protein (E3 ubiquitin-protein ligase RNF216)
MDALKSLFPNDPDPLLNAAWQEAEGDLDVAVEALLRAKEEQLADEIVIVDDQQDDAHQQDMDAMDRRMRHLLALFPDADESHLKDACQDMLDQHNDDVALAAIAERMLASPYPKRTSSSSCSVRVQADTYTKASKQRAELLANNVRYRANAFQSLLVVFPLIPKPYIRSLLLANQFLYTPTYLSLKATEEDDSQTAYQPLSVGRQGVHALVDVGGVKYLMQQAKDDPAHGNDGPLDPEFLNEVEALKLYLEKDQRLKDEALARSLNRDAYQEMDALLECGCCYDSFPFEDMVQCMEGHLFCRECARRAAEDRLGLRKTDFQCMSGEGCTAGFRLKEIQLFLDPAAYQLYHSIIQEQEVQAAVGELTSSYFVSCPFCSFGALMDDAPEDNKLFHCLKCQKTSCRLCQRESHVPMSCEEMDKDKVVALQHKVEEAMTEALLRECPSCKKRFFKEEGCNKMTCTCGTSICYICRAILRDGYKHFERKGATCKLFDDTVARNANEVLEAAKKAGEALRKETDVDAPSSWVEDIQKHERALAKDLEQAQKRRTEDEARRLAEAERLRQQQEQAVLQARIQQQRVQQLRRQQQLAAAAQAAAQATVQAAQAVQVQPARPAKRRKR